MKTNPHSHRSDPSAQVVIRSFSIGEEMNLSENEFFTIGAHPWNIDLLKSDWQQDLQLMLAHEKCLALGEIGLDHAISTEITLQKETMLHALNIAQDNKIKRAVLHVVRSHNECQSLLKNYKHFKFFLHDYQGNAQETEHWQKFNVVFSFSPRRLFKDKKLQAVFLSLDGTDKTLETDDFEISIQEFSSQVKAHFQLSDATMKQMAQTAHAFYFD